jgi:hypothetical protein
VLGASGGNRRRAAATGAQAHVGIRAVDDAGNLGPVHDFDLAGTGATCSGGGDRPGADQGNGRVGGQKKCAKKRHHKKCKRKRHKKHHAADLTGASPPTRGG